MNICAQACTAHLMNLKRSLSVIIPNYNGRLLLETYLPYTVACIKKAGVDYELIIVDDASTDDSISYITTNYPDVTLIKNAVNKGFSHTCNTGIFAAKNELIFLLNSDVKLSDDYFDKQWRYFEKDDTFGVTGRIIDMEGDRIQDSARLLKLSGNKLKTDFFYSTDQDAYVPTIYLSGANALIDAKKLKEIGGFDEIFSPFYGEDLDLGLRAWRIGWKCYYEHNSICRHQMSASTKNYKTANWVKFIYFRNRFFVHAIHLTGISKGLWTLHILGDVIGKVIARQFWIFASYKALFSNSNAINSSRDRLHLLMAKHNSKRTIYDVITEFNQMLKGLHVKRLKD